MSYGFLKDEKALLNWLRSGLRGRMWIKHPSKLGLLQKRRVRKKNANGRMIWHYECEHCHKLFKAADIEVNHKENCGTMTHDSFGEVVTRMLLVQEEDLEILCHNCHGIVTYQERYGGSPRDADIAKRVAAFSKLKAKEQVAKLEKANIPIPKPNNGKTRAALVRQFLEERIPK